MLINSYDLFVTACIWERRTFFPEREARDRDNHRGCDKWQEAFFTQYAICHFLIPRVFSPIPLLSEHSPHNGHIHTVPPKHCFLYSYSQERLWNAVAINLISPQQKIRPQQSTATDLSRDLCLACFLINLWFAGASARHLVLKNHWDNQF